MSAIAGFSSLIQTSTDDGSSDAYVDIGGADTVNFPRSRVELDATDFSHQAMVRIVGIKDASCSISGKYDASDAGQIDLDTAFSASAVADQLLWIQFLPDGTNGFKAKFVITSFEISSTTDGVVEFSCEAMLSDANGWTSV